MASTAASLQQLKELGESLGYTGVELTDFILKQQAADRAERQAEREVAEKERLAREKQAEREAAQKEREAAEKEKQMQFELIKAREHREYEE